MDLTTCSLLSKILFSSIIRAKPLIRFARFKEVYEFSVADGWRMNLLRAVLAETGLSVFYDLDWMVLMPCTTAREGLRSICSIFLRSTRF